MSEEDEEIRRLQFFGPNDLATGWFLQRAVDLAEQFDPENAPTSTVDMLELHNVQQYLEHGLLALAYNEEQHALAKARIPQIRGAVARFFTGVNDANLATVINGVAGYDYHGDLLELLGRNGAYERCAAATVLPALAAAGVHLGEILGCKKLVKAYDAEVRAELLSSPQNAEHVLRKYLQEDARDEIYLPRSITPEDSRVLLEQYIDGEGANPNYVGLIASAKETPAAGIDARLKLRAKRRGDELNAKFFERNNGIRTGCEVSVADQAEPAVGELDESDGLVCRYTYSRRWLEETLDNPSILNNFIHLFGFIDRNALLVLPSYPASLGVMERFLGTPGRTEYRIGTVFRTTDMSSLLQTRMYHHYLETKDIDLEQVISWFFEEYLIEEFQAENFSFTPSGAGASYLQMVRHLFAEMESVASQFSLFAKDGELDRDLLAMGSEQVRYKDIPSLLDGKYIYATGTDEITSILNLLFSDQASVTYISEELRGDNAAMLLQENNVAYDDFHDYQKPAIDHLIRLGIVDNDGTRVQLTNIEQFRILSALFNTQCASYFHLSDRGRAVADEMVAKGWVERRSSLLSEAEGKYFNYFLNAVDFSNGPELRNKYLHGSQVNAEGEDAHFHTYMTALRLIVALVIKMNDDFCLAAAEEALAEATE
ncbi:hypothetical protein [Nocardioides sp.]|uniref:hypothetical protein n=1 Tax=Nocardioides sp. TaxID=35761 RepID=UPI0023A5EDE0|nr:hypothetical protein [Nocardioides sp.]MDE0777802.1 hypothetical protein [Nocardioides sp.]